MFDLKTEERTWYLVAESEEDMNRWVSSICLLCGFNPTDDGNQSVPRAFLVSHLNLLMRGLAPSQREQKWEGRSDKLMSSHVCVCVCVTQCGFQSLYLHNNLIILSFLT